MRSGGKDFRTGDPIDMQVYFADRIDVHHIFPQAWCRQQHIHEKQYNSIINKTPLTAKTNQLISSHAPSAYLERIQKSAGIDKEQMDEILASHFIDPVVLRADDFSRFLTLRQAALLDAIEQAIGKTIARKTTVLVNDVMDEDAQEKETNEE